MVSKKNFNLVVSSWPSAGGTTISLVLAELLKLKYIYAGGVLKEWAKLMGYDPTSDRFHEWEANYGEVWDRFWESYIADKLSKEANFLCEGKTLGFLLAPDKAFEIVIIADLEERARRAGKDQRSESIAARDQLLAERWKRLFGIKLLDKQSLAANYDLVLDNTNLTIATSLEIIWSKLAEYYSEVEFTAEQASTIDQEFWQDMKAGKSGKDRWKSKLEEQGLYYTNEHVFKDWLDNYQDKFSQLPVEMQLAIKL